MDLKTQKYIKNTGELPQFAGAVENFDPNKNKTVYDLKSFKSRWKNGGSEAAGNAAVSTINSAFLFNSMKTPTNYADDFVGKYGTNTQLANGVGFELYNDIDEVAENSRMSNERDQKIMQGSTLGATTGLAIGSGAGMAIGGTLGSWLGPIGAIAGLGLGALFGGIFGNSAKREEERLMRIAQTKQNNANEFWRTGALSAALRNKELEDVGNTNRFSLLSSALGTENVNVKNGKTTKNVLAHTSNGIKNTKANSRLNDGEIVRNRYKGTEHYVHGNPNQIDGEYGRLEKGDDVISSTLTVPGTNVTIAQAYPIAKTQGWENELVDIILPMSREMIKNNKTNGKLTRAWGGLENIVATVPGMIQSWSDYNLISNDDIHRTQLNPFNKYEGKIADLMAGRHISVYPQMRAITNEEASLRYRTNLSGGLSAMQKTISNLVNNMNSKVARANALTNVQQIKNQYDKETADILNNMGSTIMDATTRAQMFNEQQNAAAHASKIQGLNMAKRNMLDYATQFAKNAWEKNLFDQMMDLYRQLVKIANMEAYAKAGLNPDGSKKLDIQLPKNIKSWMLSGNVLDAPTTPENFEQKAALYKAQQDALLNMFSDDRRNLIPTLLWSPDMQNFITQNKAVQNAKPKYNKKYK